MKTMMRMTLTLVVMLLGVATNTQAQVHSVFVGVNGKDTDRIANAVKAKIGGTSRFTIADDMRSAEIRIR